MAAITVSSSTSGPQTTTLGAAPAASSPRAADAASPPGPSSAVSRVASQAMPAVAKNPLKKQRKAQLKKLATIVLPAYNKIIGYGESCIVPDLLKDTDAGVFCQLTYRLLKMSMSFLKTRYLGYDQTLRKTFIQTRTVFDSTVSIAEKRRGYGLLELSLTDPLKEYGERTIYTDIETLATWMEKMPHDGLKMARAQKDDPKCTTVEYPNFIDPLDPIIINKAYPTWKTECELVEKCYTNYQNLLEMQLDYTRQFESAFHRVREQLRDMQFDTF